MHRQTLSPVIRMRRIPRRLAGLGTACLLAVMAFGPPARAAQPMMPEVTPEGRVLAGGRDILITMEKPDGAFPPTARDLSSVRRRGVLVVGQFQGDNPPFFFTEEGSGRLIGFDIDLAESLARDIGVKLVLNRSYQSFQAVADAVEAGEVDVGITNLSVTEKRKKQVDFSEPYLIGTMSLLIDLAEVEKKLAGVEVIGPSDLNRPELAAVTETGSAYEGEIKNLFPQVAVISETYGKGDRRYQAILDKKAQFMLRDGVSIAGDVMNNPAIVVERGGPLTLAVLRGTEDPYAVAVAKSAPELLKFVNAHLDRFEDVPTASSIFKKYLSK